MKPYMKRETVKDAGLWVVQRLKKNGYSAYWVGGCVRDMLLGRPIKEIDIATNAKPDDVASIFKKTIPVGAKFGVMIAVRSGYQFQVATFRTDKTYSDGRHPDSVVFADAQEDVKRRDFTINGMLYDPLKGELLDFVGGQEDLKRRIVRAIGDARERMKEDKLRLLRAIRFALMLDFEIEENTWSAVKELASEIKTISGERIREELMKIVEADRMNRAAKLLDTSGLLDSIFPKLRSLKEVPYNEQQDMREHSLTVLGTLSSPTFVEAVAVLLHNCKAQPSEREKDAETAAETLRLSREEQFRLVWLVMNQNALDNAKNRPISYLKRLYARREYPELIGLYQAKVKAGCGDGDSLDFVKSLRLHLTDEEISPTPLLDGNDLIDAGYSPSPLFGRVIDSVYDSQLEGKIKTKEEALSLARKLFAETSSESSTSSP